LLWLLGYTTQKNIEKVAKAGKQEKYDTLPFVIIGTYKIGLATYKKGRKGDDIAYVLFLTLERYS